ncbi:MAG: PopZ family protein [Pseudaminobacter sp.]
MAQASSVQREPSMEEILASIRRIIEDSDTVRKGANDGEAPAIAESGEAESAVIEVDAFRSELRAARADAETDYSAPPQAEPVRPEPASTITLAEVQARIAAETPPELPSAEDDAAEAPASEQVSPPQATDAAHEPESRDWATPQPAAEPTGAAPAWDKPQQEHAAETPAVAESLSVEQSSVPADEPAAATHSDAGAVIRPAIISEQAGRQVAAAFGELSEAFAARSRKTFEDMAEQMMRPMLQDWLDNNLPTLVERLVREEIERVARGG